MPVDQWALPARRHRRPRQPGRPPAAHAAVRHGAVRPPGRPARPGCRARRSGRGRGPGSRRRRHPGAGTAVGDQRSRTAPVEDMGVLRAPPVTLRTPSQAGARVPTGPGTGTDPVTAPEVWSRKRSRTRARVVFPEPDGPTTAIRLPGARSGSMPRRRHAAHPAGERTASSGPRVPAPPGGQGHRTEQRLGQLVRVLLERPHHDVGGEDARATRRVAPPPRKARAVRAYADRRRPTGRMVSAPPECAGRRSGGGRPSTSSSGRSARSA